MRSFAKGRMYDMRYHWLTSVMALLLTFLAVAAYGQQEAKTYDEAYELCAQGHQLLSEGEYDSALDVLFRATGYNANAELNTYVFDYIANCYYGLGDIQSAIYYEKIALGEYYDNPNVAYNLAVYLYEAGEEDKALSAFELYIINVENNENEEAERVYSAYWYQGNIYMHKSDYEKAEEAYKKGLSVVSIPVAYRSLASFYVETKRYPEAIETYKKCIGLGSVYSIDNMPDYLMLGGIYMLNGQTTDAVRAYDDCIDCFNANLTNLKQLSSSPDSLGFEVDITSFPEYSIYLNAMLWYARLSAPSKVRIARYLEVMADSSMQAEIEPLDYISLAETYYNLDEKKEGMEILKNARSKYPEDVDIMFNYALLLDDTNPKEMLALLEEILKRENTAIPKTFDYGTVYNNIAWEYCCKKNYVKALPYARQAVQKNPEHDYSWETIGEIYYHLRKYNECIDAMTKCLECSDCDSQYLALTFRGKAYKKMGYYAKGKSDLQNAKYYKK